jgi:exodeoxyribonuclease VIII
MINFMLDLETMSTAPNAAIVAIGAVAFDVDLFTLHPLEFSVKVSLASCKRLGLDISASTLEWWLQQSEAAREATFGGEKLSIGPALSAFERWLSDLVPDKGQRIVWGNGAGFDNVILASAYAAAGHAQPWMHWNDRCYRTMKNLYPAIGKPAFVGTQHKAVDDARFQAMHLLEILKGVR